MTIREIQHEIDDSIPVENVLISVFDKTNLGELANGLLEINPGLRIFSTGGTYIALRDKILSPDQQGSLITVEEYTDLPEIEGGLVKTLHPLLHTGLLGERHNPAHQAYLQRLSRRVTLFGPDGQPVTNPEPGQNYTATVTQGNGVFFDLVVVNLYPFESVSVEPGATFESSRGNIDIGGPAMLRAAAKNFLSAAPFIDPKRYGELLAHIRENRGSTRFDYRRQLAGEVFELTGGYDTAISAWWKTQTPEAARARYTFAQRGA
ncbi:hypothetical protein J4410_03565 [Candidatus Woesearchaeota archaeon]|nr:hypothetical protein [Candidatus Woesearchaeota archaeon]